MLERRGPSNLVNIGNSVSCIKQYCLPLSVILDEQHHLALNQPILVNGKALQLCKRNISVTSKRALYLVKHGELC